MAINEPTKYEKQILMNQSVIMGMLSILMTPTPNPTLAVKTLDNACRAVTETHDLLIQKEEET